MAFALRPMAAGAAATNIPAMAAMRERASTRTSKGMGALAWLRVAIWTAIAAISLACGLDVYDSALLHGTVRTQDGVPLAGVRIDVRWPDGPDPGDAFTHTDDEGRYAMKIYDGYWLDDWRHVTVTPSLEGWTFEPPLADVRVPDGGIEVDFVASPKAPLRLRAMLLIW